MERPIGCRGEGSAVRPAGPVRRRPAHRIDDAGARRRCRRKSRERRAANPASQKQQVRDTGADLRRHTMDYTTLTAPPMLDRLRADRDRFASLDARDRLIQKGYNITLLGGAPTQCL